MALKLQPEVLARAEALGLAARGIVEGLRIGDHKSPFKGFSVEFVQHREYVPGDDIRHIDWKSYGRSERYTIKQYEQETNFVGHILLDASRSMHYRNKMEYGKLLAATLAYLVIHQRDTAALHVFDNGWRARLPASSQPGHVNTVLTTLEGIEPKDKGSIGPLLREVAEQNRRRGLAFLISDCFDDVPELLKGLGHLRFQGHEVTVFHVMHRDEMQFDFEGMTRFLGLEDPLKLLTRPQLIRPAYLKALRSYMDELESGCRTGRIDHVPCDTTRPMGNMLAGWLARRLQMA
ncbi:MAG: DUF58 domain-containing protein [Gemmataceae bacterium]|nr:DUF58 domain-containing protein [Gemmataceae bacterium]